MLRCWQQIAVGIQNFIVARRGAPGSYVRARTDVPFFTHARIMHEASREEREVLYDRIQNVCNESLITSTQRHQLQKLFSFVGYHIRD